MDMAREWFRAEFDEARRHVRAGFEAVESLLLRPHTPPMLLREAFAEIDFHMKYVLALLHFEEWHYDTLVREGRLIGTLALLESTPITRASWRMALDSLKDGFAAVEASPPGFSEEIDRSGLESPRDMFVSGPDRVSEGEGEIDFDIPESSVADQVRNEIAALADEIWSRFPQAG